MDPFFAALPLASSIVLLVAGFGHLRHRVDLGLALWTRFRFRVSLQGFAAIALIGIELLLGALGVAAWGLARGSASRFGDLAYVGHIGLFGSFVAYLAFVLARRVSDQWDSRLNAAAESMIHARVLTPAGLILLVVWAMSS
ncbi:MAG TPA: hypothetical protein ENH15_02115 [Actinobacteria bacterium]|nr:hypothetical protein [Actinomycetota bacterium]